MTVRDAERWRARTVLALRVAVTLATVASTVTAAVRSQVNPALDLRWVFVPLGIAAIGQTVDTIVRGLHSHRAPLREADHRDVQQLATQVLQDVSKAANVDITKVGVCVWVISSYRPFLWRPRLKRILRFRLDVSAATPTAVDWTRGKGVIGRAWETGKKQHVDWRPIAARYPGAISDAEWTRIPADTRWGFTREEFEAVRDKYAEVLALPIADSHAPELYGVLSVDLPMDAVPPDGISRLDRRAVEKKTAIAASGVALTLKHRRV